MFNTNEASFTNNIVKIYIKENYNSIQLLTKEELETKKY